MIVFWIALIVIPGVFLAAFAYLTILASMYPETLRTNEIHTVTTRDLWKIRVCRYRRGRVEGEPVLLVHGFNANQNNFTNPEGHCLVDYLVARGYDCWTVDLRGCRSSQPPFERRRTDPTLDDYLLEDLPAVIQYIRKATGYAQVHWIGHSMGGMLLYAYVQIHGDDAIASGVTLGAPLGFVDTAVKLSGLLVFIGTHFPALAGNFLRGMVPIVTSLRIGNSLFPINLHNLPPQMNTGHYYTMLEDPPPKVLAELVFSVQNHVYRVKRDQIDVLAGLTSLRFPLLVLCAPRDPFVSVKSATEFVKGLPHEDKKLLVLSRENGCAQDYDHVDLAFGQEAAREVFSPIVEWLKAYPSTERIPTVAADEAGNDYRPPLNSAERAGILSGTSYAHADTETAKTSARDAPAGKRPGSRQKAAAKKPAVARKAAARPKTAAQKKTNRGKPSSSK